MEFHGNFLFISFYSTAKSNLNANIPKANRDSPFVHVTSAATAGKLCLQIFSGLFTLQYDLFDIFY